MISLCLTAAARLEVENDGDLKLFLPDGAQIWEDDDVTAPEVVHGKTITLAKELLIFPGIPEHPSPQLESAAETPTDPHSDKGMHISYWL